MLGARFETGAEVVTREIGLDDALAGANWLITGEGRSGRPDPLHGKAPFIACKRARCGRAGDLALRRDGVDAVALGKGARTSWILERTDKRSHAWRALRHDTNVDATGRERLQETTGSARGRGVEGLGDGRDDSDARDAFDDRNVERDVLRYRQVMREQSAIRVSVEVARGIVMTRALIAASRGEQAPGVDMRLC